MENTKDRKDASSFWLDMRFQSLEYLQQPLYKRVVGNAVLFDKPLPFKPKPGCQNWMQVSNDFWNEALSCEKPEDQDVKKAAFYLLITLGADETDSILAGEQQYLLRSQQVKLGLVHLAVKSMDFAIPGRVEFASQKEFTSCRAFNRWEGYKGCNPADLLATSAMMKRLKEGKSVFAVELVGPTKLDKWLEWSSSAFWLDYIF